MKKVALVACPQMANHLKSMRLKVFEFDDLPSFATAENGLAAVVLYAPHLASGVKSETIKSILSQHPLTEVIIWAPKANAQTVREALKSGARDVLLSTSAKIAAGYLESIVLTPETPQALKDFRKLRPNLTRFEGMISRSRQMWDIFELCVRIAITDATVLILGETGTGKEMLARAIHRRSGRPGRFVAVNCAAIPTNLIDSELFGHVKGAFTGAVKDKPGLFRYAQHGTLFLDEIGDIPDSLQFSLLRALQESAIRPVGSSEEVAIDTRVIAATSSPLEEKVASGQFREDLFYRLDVMRMILPPLRERPEDIVFLFSHFAKILAKEYRVAVPNLREDFLDALLKYEWPGNVRQLENIAERVVLTQPNEKLTEGHFRRILHPYKKAKELARQPAAAELLPSEIELGLSLAAFLEKHQGPLEKSYLTALLAQNLGAIAKSAAQAGINRRTLLRKMKQYQLDKKSFR